jgi:hypothetical protein
MKAIKIALIAILANLLLLLGLLVGTNIQNPHHLGNINWIAFGPIDLLYAIMVAALGWLMGSLVNGLLVYPERRTRNYSVSQLNTGILCFLVVLYFAWSTGSFGKDNSHPRQDHGYVDMSKTWSNSDVLYQNVVNRGLHAF